MSREEERIKSDPKYMAKVAGEKLTADGSWGKAVLFGLLGMQNAAKAELDKLGVGAKFDTYNIDGKEYLIKVRADGLPVGGIDVETGQAIPASIYQKVAGGEAQMKGAQVGTSTFMDPVTKETLTKVDTTRGPIWYNKARQRVVPQGEPIPNTVGGNLALQGELADFRIREAIIKKGLTNVQDAKKDYISKNGPFGTATNPMSEQDFERIHSGQMNQLQTAPRVGPPTTTAPTAVPTTPTAPAAPTAPATAPAATPAATTAPTAGGGYVTEAMQKGRDEIVKNSAEVLKDEATMISQINSGNKVIDILDNKKTNFGSILQGQLPGEQFIGKKLGTTDARNTQKVMEYIDKVTATGAKALGANPTNRDLEFLLNNRPNESWPAADVRDWIESTQEKIKDSIEVARKQVQSGGTYQPPVPGTGGTGAKPAGVKGGSGTKEDPYKL
jgi:hypothetical protein